MQYLHFPPHSVLMLCVGLRQAEDVAAAVVYALSAPSHVDVNDILMRPVQQKT